MDKTWSNAYATLAACMRRGTHVFLGLQSGETLVKYRSHDIVAPAGFEIHIDMSQAVLRGIVWPYRGELMDRLIGCRDIKTVREHRFAARYSADAGFSERNPVPEGWVRVESCRLRPGP